MEKSVRIYGVHKTTEWGVAAIHTGTRNNQIVGWIGARNGENVGYLCNLLYRIRTLVENRKHTALRADLL